MRKTLIPLAVASITFGSCQKIYDHIHNHDKPIPCKVLNIHREVDGFESNADIFYNNWGYPKNVNYSYEESESPALEYTFNYTYDSKKRLRSETSTWVYSEPVRYYAYVGNAEWPVRDTVPGLFGDIYVEDFEYDQYHRITKILRRLIFFPDNSGEPFPDVLTKYWYDQNGNRQEDPSNDGYPGPIYYTQKPSLVSLHPVWRLVHRDFSVNSIDYAKTYNNKGLPTEIKTASVPYFQRFLNLWYGSKITYQCK